MKILVTGGLGLIGHNVVKRLQEQGHTTSIIDNRTTYGFEFAIMARMKESDQTFYTLKYVNTDN